MPKKTPQPCRSRGCICTTTDRSGYCDEHQGLESNWSNWRKGKGNRHQCGYGSRWDKLRKQILLRDNGLCQECDKQGRATEATHVDHIKPKSQGGSDRHENLQSLCKPCHNHKTATERGRGV